MSLPSGLFSSVINPYSHGLMPYSLPLLELLTTAVTLFKRAILQAGKSDFL
jgi:hypothetical protein